MQTIAAIPFVKLGPWTPIPGMEWPKIYAFGMFVALGLLVCLGMATWRGENKLGIDGERIQNYGLWLILVGWFFAHLLNVAFYEPHKVAEDPLLLVKVWGSISSYGGLIGGVIGHLLWRRWNPDEDHLLWLDHSVWALTFAWMFGRLGCSSVHDHLGLAASQAWPLAFDVPARFGGGFRHDLGFYEFLWWIVIVATILILDRKPRTKGLYTAIVPLMYAPVRFTLDFLRLWPLPEGGGEHEVSAIGQFFLDLFGTQPESFGYHQGVPFIYQDGEMTVYNGETWQQLTSSQEVQQILADGNVYFADTRYFGLTPAQYLSIGLFVFGLVMLYRIWDNEPIEWKKFQPRGD